MSHIKQYQSSSKTPDNRSLGDEWLNWDGHNDGAINEGRFLFMIATACVIALVIATLIAVAYMIAPRLALWNPLLPKAVWIVATIINLVLLVWLIQLATTVITGRNFLFTRRRSHFLFDIIFSGAFRFAKLFRISRDRMGNSFVKVSNTISRALTRGGREEKLLLLLPRCLVKEELQKINQLKEVYPLHIHTVSGGELARKKVKEVCPTAIRGVACERDLVSGIRDVGGRLSVIGIPNQRPNGPCKDTHIDMDELISAIEFYVGPPKPQTIDHPLS